MLVHDWTRVEAGVFHHFHHRWITAITDALNAGLLPPEYYALAEQQAAGFGPDILTLQSTLQEADDEQPTAVPSNGGGGLLLAPPRVQFTSESTREFYRRKKSTIVVRHVCGDHIVAVVELISPGNKGGRNAMKALIDKACELLEHKIHLLILDLFPPIRRDLNGIHSALWEEITDESFSPPPDKPLTLAAYESGLTIKAYVEPLAVGDALPDMPLFLEPGAHVRVPLEATYRAAFDAVPRRWRQVLESLHTLAG